MRDSSAAAAGERGRGREERKEQRFVATPFDWRLVRKRWRRETKRRMRG